VVARRAGPPRRLETGRCAEVEHRTDPSDKLTRPVHVTICKEHDADQLVQVVR
jgi:hypothetical protein